VAQSNLNTAEIGRLHLLGLSLRLEEEQMSGAVDLLQPGGNAAAT